MLIFIGIDAVDHVVGGHDAFRLRFFDGDFKARQIEFPEGPFIYDGIGCLAPQLGIVGRKMLRTGGNAVFLDAADVACRQLAGKVRVFREVLEVAPA